MKGTDLDKAHTLIIMELAIFGIGSFVFSVLLVGMLLFEPDVDLSELTLVLFLVVTGIVSFLGLLAYQRLWSRFRFAAFVPHLLYIGGTIFEMIYYSATTGFFNKLPFIAFLTYRVVKLVGQVNSREMKELFERGQPVL